MAKLYYTVYSIIEKYFNNTVTYKVDESTDIEPNPPNPPPSTSIVEIPDDIQSNFVNALGQYIITSNNEILQLK